MQQLRSSSATKALLDQRALALSRPAVVAQANAGAALDVVTFAVDQERYGLEACYVRRILPFTDFNPLPASPAFLVGMINLGGELLAVIDLRRVLGLTGQHLTDLSRLLVLGRERDEFGILADTTEELFKLDPHSLIPLPRDEASQQHPMIRATTGAGLVLLAGDVLLADESLYIDQSDC